MKKGFIQRPLGPWRFVKHNDEAHYTAEAILEVDIAVGKKAQQPAEIRLTDEDVERLLDVPELKELLLKRLFGDVPSRDLAVQEDEPQKFDDIILARTQRLLEMSPAAFKIVINLPAVRAMIDAVESE